MDESRQVSGVITMPIKVEVLATRRRSSLVRLTAPNGDDHTDQWLAVGDAMIADLDIRLRPKP